MRYLNIIEKHIELLKDIYKKPLHQRYKHINNKDDEKIMFLGIGVKYKIHVI